MMDLVWRHATNRNYDVVNATHDNSDDDDTLHCDNYTPERRTNTRFTHYAVFKHRQTANI